MGALMMRAESASNLKAASVVKSGGLVVYPTDTVYGLGCDPLNGSAVDRVFEAKGRESKPLPVLCSTAEAALRVVDLAPAALALAERHWPGALTIVATLRIQVPRRLDQGTGTLGVRVPGSPGCRELVAACGGVLTGTSANISGRPSCRTADEAAAQLGGSVDVILDGGRLEGLESTVVRVTGNDVIVLRQGPVRVEDTTK